MFVESSVMGGGSAVSLYEYLRAAAWEDVEPSVVFLNENRFASRLASLGVRVYAVRDLISSKHSPRFLRGCLTRTARRIAQCSVALGRGMLYVIHCTGYAQVKRIIQYEKPDILHTNVHPNSEMFAILAASAAGVHSVAHVRHMGGIVSPAVRDEVNRSVSAVVTPSNASKRYCEDMGLDRSKVTVIPNGVDVVRSDDPWGRRGKARRNSSSFRSGGWFGARATHGC